MTIDWTVGQSAQTVDFSRAAEVHQPDRALLSRLEPHRGSGGDREVLTPGGPPVKSQGAVHLEEVGMRPDLDRPVAGVRHEYFDRVPAGVC